MSRRSGARTADSPMGSPADDGGPPKKGLWLFLAVAGGLTALWVVLSLPRTENPEEPMPFTTKRAGWPDHFARWSVSKETGQTGYSSFSVGALLGDLVVLAAPIVVAWVIIRKLSNTPDQAAVRHRGMRGPAPSPEVPPSRRPSGTPRASGGWG